LGVSSSLSYEEEEEEDEEDEVMEELVKSFEITQKFISNGRSSRSSDKARIIIAEDQLINIEVLKSQFYKLGCQDQIDLCYNGEEALLKAESLISDKIEEALELN
jgi:hypothetical protein